MKIDILAEKVFLREISVAATVARREISGSQSPPLIWSMGYTHARRLTIASSIVRQSLSCQSREWSLELIFHRRKHGAHPFEFESGKWREKTIILQNGSIFCFGKANRRREADKRDMEESNYINLAFSPSRVQAHFFISFTYSHQGRKDRDAVESAVTIRSSMCSGLHFQR